MVLNLDVRKVLCDFLLPLKPDPTALPKAVKGFGDKRRSRVRLSPAGLPGKTSRGLRTFPGGVRVCVWGEHTAPGGAGLPSQENELDELMFCSWPLGAAFALVKQAGGKHSRRGPGTGAPCAAGLIISAA